MEIIEKLKERNEFVDKLEQLEQMTSDYKKLIEKLDGEILNLARNNMLDELTVDGQKYKISSESSYYIQETKSDHSKKVELLKRLVEMGEGRDDIRFFESGFIHAAKLKKIMKDLPRETINMFIDDKLISVVDRPKIEKKKAKKENENN
jgi:hypothetical protein